MPPYTIKVSNNIIDYLKFNTIELIVQPASVLVIYIIHKETGINIVEVKYAETTIDGGIVSSFLKAQNIFGEKFESALKATNKNTKKGKKRIRDVFEYGNVIFTLIYSKYLMMAIVSDINMGKIREHEYYRLLENYERLHENDLDNFESDVSPFRDFPSFIESDN